MTERVKSNWNSWVLFPKMGNLTIVKTQITKSSLGRTVCDVAQIRTVISLRGV